MAAAAMTTARLLMYSMATTGEPLEVLLFSKTSDIRPAEVKRLISPDVSETLVRGVSSGSNFNGR